MKLFLHCARHAFFSIGYRNLLGIFLLTLLANGILLASLVFGGNQLLAAFNFAGDYDGLLDTFLTFVLGFLAFMLFPLLQPIIVSFFVEGIASRIEANEYPAMPKPTPPFWPTIRQDIAFTLKVLGLNLLALPLYFIPVIGFLTYYVLNGLLLGTEFFNAVAGRHISPEEARKLRSQQKLLMILNGTAITVLATIPLINLITPIWGVAVNVHALQKMRATNEEKAG